MTRCGACVTSESFDGWFYLLVNVDISCVVLLVWCFFCFSNADVDQDEGSVGWDFELLLAE